MKKSDQAFFNQGRSERDKGSVMKTEPLPMP
jgi:hypothetical protein